MTDEQRRRTSVTPGITGLAQAKGRNALSIFDKINYDLEYVNNFSLREDVKVITLTVLSFIRKEEENAVDAGKLTIHSEIDELKAQKADE